MKKTITTLAALAISCLTYAQSELSGNWTFQKQESISGKLYSNGSPETIKINVDGSNVIIEKSTAVGDGTYTKISETVSLDGKAFETVTASKRKKVITLKKDGTKYIEYAILYNVSDPTKIDRKVTDTWSIENGQLLLDRKDENIEGNNTWESKATYSK
jgi:hypothetical protein